MIWVSHVHHMGIICTSSTLYPLKECGNHMHTTRVLHVHHIDIICTSHEYHMYTTWVSYAYHVVYMNITQVSHVYHMGIICIPCGIYKHHMSTVSHVYHMGIICIPCGYHVKWLHVMQLTCRCSSKPYRRIHTKSTPAIVNDNNMVRVFGSVSSCVITMHKNNRKQPPK